MWIGILVVIVMVFFWAMGVQRSLVSLDERCKNALSQIGVQMNSRWDALTALVDLAKSYADHEYKALMDVIGARARITGASTPEEVNEQETALSAGFGRLLAVAEAYPDLKANENYMQTMAAVEKYEENVRLSRMVYNDTITRFNAMVRQLPSSLIAGMLGFAVREYLQEPQGKTEMPSMVR